MATKTKKNLSQKIPKNASERALARLYGNQGANAANAVLNKFVPPGSFGSVSTNVPGSDQILKRYDDLANQYGSRDPEQAGLVDSLKKGLDGYTSEEYQAQREQMARGLNSNLATSLGQLAKAQARGKVYGAAGVAQQQNQMQAAQNTKDTLEQDLMVKNIDEKQKRAYDYGNYLQGLTQGEFDRQAGLNKDRTDSTIKLGENELEREKINIGNKQAEIGTQIGLWMGTAGQGLAKAQNKAAQRIQRQALRAVRRYG